MQSCFPLFFNFYSSSIHVQVSTRKKRQSNRRLRSQLDDFDQDIIIGNTASDRQENTTVIEGTGDREFTVGSPDSSLAVMKLW